MDECLRAIAQYAPVLNAFNLVATEAARAAANRAQSELRAGHDRGPLHGIPFGVKDVYDVAGLPTTGYSRAFLDRKATGHATAVARLVDAGAVFVGKLATHELANGGPSFDLPWPPARNPWDLERVTGGSSTGAGAAVAAGLLPAALGTDTGGSVRIPASMCGVTGLKPTAGRVSGAGVLAHSHSIDHCGPLAWTVEDCAILLQAIAGADPRSPAASTAPVPDYRAGFTPHVRGLRIGIVRRYWETDLPADTETASALEDAIDVLRSLGASVETIDLPPLHQYYDVKTVIAKREVFDTYRPFLVERLDRFGADFLGMTLGGCLYGEDDLHHAHATRQRLAAAMDAALQRCDLLMTASSGPAARFEDYGPARVIDHWSRPNRETPFSVTGCPALALCIGFTRAGLPLGMQLAGRRFDEATVLRAGHAYERAAGWRARRPVLPDAAPPLRVPVKAAYPEPDAATRARAVHALHAHGVWADEMQLRQLCAVLPHALEAARRVAGRQ
jgi:aspartyl-tRNA(Asn)/glutamyl-tRNA(Gln) amidotransferase subunit A